MIELEPAAIAGFFTVLGVVIAVGTVFWKAALWKGGVDADLKRAEDHRSTVTDLMKEIRDDFREVRDDIKKLFRELPKQTVGSNSPTRLNKLGGEIARKLDAQGWAVRHARKLTAEVHGKEAFEVDTFAFDFVYGDLAARDEAMSTRVEQCAYEFGVSRDNVLAVLQVVLRDELLIAQAGPEA